MWRFFFFFSSRRRHTRLQGDWSSDVCSSDLRVLEVAAEAAAGARVRVGIRPEDVTLTVADGARVASSARNALDGTVTRVSASTHATHVLVDVGFPLVAAVTARSVNELGLRPGARVRAVFKASAAHLILA